MWYCIKYNEYYNECNNIWTIILFSSIINVITSIIIYSNLSLISEISYDMNSNSNIIYLLQIIICGISALLYSIGDDECSIFWKENAYELWLFIYLEYIFFWFISSVIFLNIIYEIVKCCKYLNTNY